jgi:hypothetical protein
MVRLALTNAAMTPTVTFEICATSITGHSFSFGNPVFASLARFCGGDLLGAGAAFAKGA